MHRSLAPKHHRWATATPVHFNKMAQLNIQLPIIIHGNTICSALSIFAVLLDTSQQISIVVPLFRMAYVEMGTLTFPDCHVSLHRLTELITHRNYFRSLLRIQMKLFPPRRRHGAETQTV